MDVRITQPLGYSEPGGRSNNEDSIYPDPQATSTGQKWFLVCDGVGGAERGEVASRLAVTGLDTFFRQSPVAVATDAYIQQAVAYVESQFNAYLSENPQASGMATTMTLLYIHEAGATVAHIGDSRVYHIRGGSVIWCTDDHSYVNELVKAGVLTPKEAHHHPQRNIITRALQGGNKSVHASVQLINDLRPGDYFFLCSDGVLERISDTLLEGTLWSRTDSNEQKLAKLRGYSAGATRDNFTAYLIQVDQVTGTVAPMYQVAPPVYERVSAETDTDESITLINMPIPDAGKAPSAPTPQPVAEEVVASQEPLYAPPQPVAEGPAPARITNPELDTLRRGTPLPARRSSSPWSVALLALTGALIGAGGIIAWQTFFNKPTVADYTQKPDSQRAQSAATTPSPAVATPPAHTVPPATQPNDAKEETAATVPRKDLNTQSEASQSAGLSLDSPERSLTDAEATPASGYEEVRKVDNQLWVVRDPKTKLMGLRKANGQWPAGMKYIEIGSFQNGVAEVKPDKGQEKYLSKAGKKFRSMSDYKDGVATLIEVDGPANYLSKGGKWLDEIKSTSNKLIAVKKDNRWGYLDRQGQVAIAMRYDKAESFADDGTAEVTLDGRTFRIDKKGIKITGKESPKSAAQKGELKKGPGSQS